MVDMKSLLTMQGMVFAMLLVGVCYLLHLEPLVAEVITSWSPCRWPTLRRFWPPSTTATMALPAAWWSLPRWYPW